jgi:hypothetical protein
VQDLTLANWQFPLPNSHFALGERTVIVDDAVTFHPAALLERGRGEGGRGGVGWGGGGEGQPSALERDWEAGTDGRKLKRGLSLQTIP